MQTFPQEAFSSSPPGSVFHFLGLLFRQAVSLYRLARWPSGSSRLTTSLQPANPVRRNHLFQEILAKALERWCLVQLAYGPFPEPITVARLVQTLISHLYDRKGRRPSTSHTFNGFSTKRCVQLQGKL